MMMNVHLEHIIVLWHTIVTIQRDHFVVIEKAPQAQPLQRHQRRFHL